jgi:hypothetical protein
MKTPDCVDIRSSGFSGVLATIARVSAFGERNPAACQQRIAVVRRRALVRQEVRGLGIHRRSFSCEVSAGHGSGQFGLHLNRLHEDGIGAR